MFRPRLIYALVLALFALPVMAAEPAAPLDHWPEPSSLKRYGPGFRYTQAGWVVLHIEGEPYARGYQHGRLLANEIAAQVRMLAAVRSPKAPADGWRHLRTLANALFLRRFDREYLEEMKGIAEGAADAGATFDRRPLDLVDVLAVNTWMETETLDAALHATPTGLEGTEYPRPVRKPGPPRPPKRDHCSAFIATGPATADGKIVFGHVTMGDLAGAQYANVWIDVAPKQGRRFVMQAFPGGIWSSQDYYINDAGILLAETTIEQTAFDAAGTPLTNRARKAIQYSRSIDDVVKHLSAANNGLYSNEWLIGDTKTNEIAMFELGTKATKLRRSSRNEWFGGTKGFYWGCNNGKELAVRLEAISPGDRPRNWTWKPDDRDEAWLKLYREYAGKIDARFGRRAFADEDLAKTSSFDAKVTTAALANRLATQAVYGPPTGKEWKPTNEEKENYPEIRPLVTHPWTVLRIVPVSRPAVEPDPSHEPLVVPARPR